VQIVSAQDYQQHLETQAFRTVRIPAIRGKILDRNGYIIADDAPNYSISLYLDDLRDEFKKEYTRLRAREPMRRVTNSPPFWKVWNRSTSVKMMPAKLTKKEIEALTWQARYDVASNVVAQVGTMLQKPVLLDSNDFVRHYQARLALPYPVLPDIPPDLVARFEEQNTNPTNGVDLEILSARYYPLGTTAAHLLGHLQRDDSSAEGEESYFTYRLPDYRGIVGIEYGFDAALRGHAGGKSVLVNNQGYRQSESVWEPVEPGSNVVLTLDLRIQQAAEQALAAAATTYTTPVRGAAIVMDVNTGDILALASAPVFNPNNYVQGFPPGEYTRMQELTAEKNRATYETYAPGSTFKPIVGLACLENGLNPKAIIYNPGFIYVGKREIKDLAAPGDYDFRKAIMESSNTYFITNGMKAGIENIVRLGHRLHFGERMDLDNRQDSRGAFPSLEQVRDHWTGGETANLCIGQGYIAVTPLQITVMTAALANGGKVLWPRFVDHIQSADSTFGSRPGVVYAKGRVRDNLGVSQRSLGILKDAMHAEVEEGGTGHAAAVPGLEICGKTGTAEIMDEHNRMTGRTTWFISYAPEEKPRYAVVVMVEGGLFGGSSCAPAAKKIYEAILKAEQTPTTMRTAAN
jgi:penicillin-binding protein 2